MSDFERVAIVTIGLALLLAVGSAIGFGFFVNDSSQWSTSGLNHVSRDHLRSDEANVASEIRQPLRINAAIRSKGKTDSTAPFAVPNTATALSNVQQDVSEPSTPAGGANTIKAAGPSD